MNYDEPFFSWGIVVFFCMCVAVFFTILFLTGISECVGCL
jgi:hypothetical protein